MNELERVEARAMRDTTVLGEGRAQIGSELPLSFL